MSTGVATSARAICVVRDPILRRTLRRSLCGGGGLVEFRESLEGALPPDSILFVHHDSAPGRELAALTRGMGERGRVVVLGGSLDDRELVAMLRERALDHVIADSGAPDEHELAVTSAKLHSGDIFGLEKYLAWGVAVTEIEVSGYDEKVHAIDELGRAADSLGARRRLVTRIQSTADELLMNALYDAPAAGAASAARSARGTGRTPAVAPEPAGSPPNGNAHGHGSASANGGASPAGNANASGTANADRSAAAPTALLRYACDGRHMAVSVLDRFGSLDKREVLDAVLRARAELGRPRAQGGAGLGLYFVLSSVTRFIVNLQPGRQTEVVCLFDLRERGRDAAGWARSLHVFTAEE